MTIKKTRDGDSLTLELQGRLDVNSAPELKELLDSELSGVTALVFDLKELEFISSAGIRVITAAQKQMNKQGSMKIKNVNSIITEIFKLTGLINVFDIE
ncbi:STAS domain-containing protein [Ruminococcaceae bacterium FB2012]|nr:STAS domain-containing protein [Ruminococcaceae bacterium FB2012]